MTKKGKPRTPKQLQENASTKEDKSSLKKPGSENTTVQEDNSSLKKLGSEIDEIFVGKKRKKPVTEKTEKANEDSNSKPKKMTKKKDKGFKDEDPADSSSEPRKKTHEGLTIYTEEELGINKADAGAPCCSFGLGEQQRTVSETGFLQTEMPRCRGYYYKDNSPIHFWSTNPCCCFIKDAFS